MTDTRDYHLLRMAAPFLLLGLCFLSIFLPPLFLALPAAAVWIDGRTGGIGATLALTLTLGVLFWVVAPGMGLAASLCFSAPAVAARILLRRGRPFATGMFAMLAVSFGALVLALLAAFWTFGGDLVGAVVDGLRELLLQLPGESVDDILTAIAASLAMTADPSLVENASDLIAQYQAMTREALLGQLLPYLETSLRVTLPATLLRGVLILGGGTWLTAGYLLRGAQRKGRPVPSWLQAGSLPGDFAGFSFPGWVTTPLLLILVAAFVMQFFGGDGIFAVSYAAQEVIGLVFMVQGMALVSWWCVRKRFPMAGRVALIVLGWLVLGGEILFLLGVVDAMFHLRQFTAMRDAMLRRQNGARENKNDEEDPKK